MRTIAVLLIATIYSGLAAGQNKTTLKSQMWQYIDDCHSTIVSSAMDSGLEPEVIDDSSNGYLKVSGSWPTCGCGCESTVGAYKTANNNYVFLITEYWNCNYKYRVRSSQQFQSIMPKGFGLSSFIDTIGINCPNRNRVFYLEVDIPRYGTETKFTIKLIPLGLLIICPNDLCLAIEQSWKEYNFKDLYYLKDIAESATAILKGDFDSMSEKDKKIIDARNDGATFQEKFKKVKDDMEFVYTRYQVYKRMKYKSLTMKWNAKEARFQVVKKEQADPVIDFKQFIADSEFWGTRC